MEERLLGASSVLSAAVCVVLAWGGKIFLWDMILNLNHVCQSAHTLIQLPKTCKSGTGVRIPSASSYTGGGIRNTLRQNEGREENTEQTQR